MTNPPYASIFQHAPLPMFAFDRDGRVAVANDQFAALVGWPVDALPGASVGAFFADAGPLLALAAPDPSAAPRRLELAARLPDGSTLPAEVQGVHVAGPPALVVCSLRPSPAEGSPGETLARLNEALDPRVGDDFFTTLASRLAGACGVTYAVVGMLDHDSPGTVQVIAAAHGAHLLDPFRYAIAGTPCERVMERSLCYVPADVQRTYPTDAMLVEMGIQAYMGVPLFSSEGAPLGLVALLHDRAFPRPAHAETVLRVVAARASAELERVLGERALRRSEAALRIGEARHRAVLEASLDALIVMDAAGRIVDFSRAAEGMFGYRRDEAVGRAVADLIVPERLRGAHQRGLERYLATRQPVLVGRRMELSALRADGTEFDIELLVGVVEGTDPPLFSAAVRDITERQRLEQELRHSQKMLAIGQLAGGVAHDFNNLLTVIQSHIELLLERVAPGAGGRESVEAIRDAGERAALLTRQLLLFSRKGPTQPVVLDLNDVVARTFTMLKRLIGEDIDTTTATAPEVPAVRCDPGQLEQILVNLALNARDAMPLGGRLIFRTRAAHLDAAACAPHQGCQAGAYASLSVTDSGVGMPPEVAARVFEPFFTTKAPGKGTGLGLATVYAIVQQHGGFITVSSSLGTGTTFEIFLPATADAPPARAGSEEGTPIARGTETILLVEDEAAVRDLAARSLTRYGYTVLTAGRGSTALAIVDGHDGPIDLIVSDVVMPEMTGRQIVQAVRARRGHTRALFISGYDKEFDGRDDLFAKQDAFLQKPFTPSTLARRVREILDVPAERGPGTRDLPPAPGREVK